MLRKIYFSVLLFEMNFFVSIVGENGLNSIINKFESESTLKYPDSLIDLSCLCNSFRSKFKKNFSKNDFCSQRIEEKFSEIKKVDGLTFDEHEESFIFNAWPIFGIKGIHLKLFVDKSENFFVVFRHQEHDSILSDEMIEMMSLFAVPATVDRQNGNKQIIGTHSIGSLLRLSRRTFGLDHFSQALTILQRIESIFSPKKLFFTGFSAAGLFSALCSIYFQRTAIVFGSTGAEDIVEQFYSELFQNRTSNSTIFHFAHQQDPVIQLDCQFGTICLFQQKTQQDRHEIHIETIFGDDGPKIIDWLNQTDLWRCETSENFNEKYGTCSRKRNRIKDEL